MDLENALAPRTPRWVHAANAAGLALCVIHIGLAMGSVHGWSHAAAIDATAIQTDSVYGLRWGGGVFVNYLFVIVWAPFVVLIGLTGFEILVALLQAFIFTILTAVYIGGAMHPEH